MTPPSGREVGFGQPPMRGIFLVREVTDLARTRWSHQDRQDDRETGSGRMNERPSAAVRAWKSPALPEHRPGRPQRAAMATSLLLRGDCPPRCIKHTEGDSEFRTFGTDDAESVRGR